MIRDYDFLADDLQALRDDQLDDIVGGLNPAVKCAGATIAHPAAGCI
jgi:hypothetical protein